MKPQERVEALAILIPNLGARWR